MLNNFMTIGYEYSLIKIKKNMKLKKQVIPFIILKL